MQVDDITEDRLRRLAGLVVEDARVLSLYLDLDPSEFGTQPARATAIRSLLNDADRQIRERDDLSHDEQSALRDDLARAQEFLEGDDFSADGAHALAVFVSGPADLFAVLRLPRPTEARAVIDTSPFIEPLAELGVSDRWAIALVSRKTGRILRRSEEHTSELQSRHY